MDTDIINTPAYDSPGVLDRLYDEAVRAIGEFSMLRLDFS